MGIFYERVPIYQAASPVLKKAFSESPPDIKQLDVKIREGATEIAQKTAGKFSWKRFGVAVGFLIFLLILALYTGRFDEYAELYSKLVSAIELLIGGIVGIVLGESASG